MLDRILLFILYYGAMAKYRLCRMKCIIGPTVLRINLATAEGSRVLVTTRALL